MNFTFPLYIYYLDQIHELPDALMERLALAAVLLISLLIDEEVYFFLACLGFPCYACVWFEIVDLTYV